MTNVGIYLQIFYDSMVYNKMKNLWNLDYWMRIEIKSKLKDDEEFNEESVYRSASRA